MSDEQRGAFLTINLILYETIEPDIPLKVTQEWRYEIKRGPGVQALGGQAQTEPGPAPRKGEAG